MRYNEVGIEVVWLEKWGENKVGMERSTPRKI
jgi:hypothetical protein